MPQPWEYEPHWWYTCAKHDLQRIWPNRNGGADWVRGACRRDLAHLKSIRHLRKD
jgi:hypothetical protein